MSQRLRKCVDRIVVWWTAPASDLPQWQGGGTSSVRELASEFPFDVARRGYAVGSTVLDAVLPPHDGPSVAVPVSMSNEGLEERDGIEAKTVILDQLAQALKVIAQHDPARITTLGGECSVSVAPFAALLTDTATTSRSCGSTRIPTLAPESANIPRYHAMAVSALVGGADPEVQALLPATVSPDRVALVGLHAWTDDDYPNIAAWGLTSFSPDDLRESSQRLLD